MLQPAPGLPRLTVVFPSLTLTRFLAFHLSHKHIITFFKMKNSRRQSHGKSVVKPPRVATHTCTDSHLQRANGKKHLGGWSQGAPCTADTNIEGCRHCGREHRDSKRNQKMKFSCNPAVFVLGMHPRERKSPPHKAARVHRGATHNSECMATI